MNFDEKGQLRNEDSEDVTRQVDISTRGFGYKGYLDRVDLDAVVQAEAADFDRRHRTVWRDGFYYKTI